MHDTIMLVIFVLFILAVLLVLGVTLATVIQYADQLRARRAERRGQKHGS